MKVRMSSAQALTLTEAGYVLNRSEAALNKAVDTGIIRARQRRVGSGVQRLLGRGEIRFLLVADRLERDLTPAGRRRLYEAIRHYDAPRVAFGEVELDLGKIDADLKSRLHRLDELRRWGQIGSDRNEPLIKGTKIPVYMVAALARGQSVEQIVDDFPSLKRHQVGAVIEYAKAYPKRGRPYPPRSLKPSLAELAGLARLMKKPRWARLRRTGFRDRVFGRRERASRVWCAGQRERVSRLRILTGVAKATPIYSAVLVQPSVGSPYELPECNKWGSQRLDVHAVIVVVIADPSRIRAGKLTMVGSVADRAPRSNDRANRRMVG